MTYAVVCDGPEPKSREQVACTLTADDQQLGDVGARDELVLRVRRSGVARTGRDEALIDGCGCDI